MILISMLCGSILGFIYWYYCGCYWGVFPLSSECWANCVLGGILGGFVASVHEENKNS